MRKLVLALASASLLLAGQPPKPVVHPATATAKRHRHHGVVTSTARGTAKVLRGVGRVIW